MYPGYSPADHIYGEAAQEYGQHVAELKRKGVDLETDPNGPQYVVGQNKKPRRLTQELEKPQSTGTPSTSAQVGNGEEGDGEPMEGVVQSGNDSQYFVIDSKPTPVAELGESQKHKNKANDKAKRRVSFTEEGEVQIANTGSSSTPDLSKASETTMESFATTTKSDAAVPDEDISGEVEARLKAKEEKRKQKEEKKRKRESENSLTNDQVQGSQTDASGPTETSSTEKRKKKKHKKDVDGVTDAADAPVKAADETKSKGEKKKKKKRADTDEVATVSAPAEEKLKKMRKKEAASSE